MDYITPVLTGIAVVIGAVGVYLKTRAGNTATYADGWKGYAKKLEERISALEIAQTHTEEEYSRELAKKNMRITELEKRVDFLEVELSKQLTINSEKVEKVEHAKQALHNEVETNLETLKS